MADLDALQYIHEVAQRAIDQQVSAFDVERQNADSLVRLGVASVAGSLAAAGLMQQAGLATPPGLGGLMGAGVLVQVSALSAAILLRRGKVASVGPEPAVLYRAIADAWGKAGVMAAAIEAMSLAHRRNTDMLASQRSRASRATVALISGVLLTTVAAFLIVGGAIFA